MTAAAITTAMHANALMAGQVAARAIATSIRVAVTSPTAKQPTATGAISATLVFAFIIGAALEIASLLDALAIRAVAFNHHASCPAVLAGVRPIDVEQKEPVNDRTTAASGDDHGSEAHVEHVFHSGIPSIRKRRPAAMGRRTDSSETTGGIGRMASAG